MQLDSNVNNCPVVLWSFFIFRFLHSAAAMISMDQKNGRITQSIADSIDGETNLLRQLKR